MTRAVAETIPAARGISLVSKSRGSASRAPAPVDIGHRTGATVEIVKGLTPGMKVVLFPSDKIDDRVAIRARSGGD